MKKCDIIIPIYNAYDCLSPCIDSVINNTDMNNNRIILINDKSTDKRVLPLLKKYANNKNIILIENKRNLGFVGTVNVGMKHSKTNDVLLLNSDTEVTSNWLSKIQECAYSAKNIATVTPLSNNATLASVPNSFYPNDIPEGYTLESFAKLVEESSLKSYPEVPTGHGFCLFIKRSALNTVGYFDEKAFGKGYGEENDFCFRCLDVGLVNVICDDTYIFHKESQSFTESKIELMKNGGKKLEEKYPLYKNILDGWVQSHNIDYIGNNIKLHLSKKQYNKPNILFVIHDWDVRNLGGTTMHARDIISKLISDYNFHVLSFNDGFYKVHSYYGNLDYPVVTKYHAINIFNHYHYYNEQYNEMFRNIIHKYSIDLVHIHHFINHYFDIVDICKEENIKTIFTFHDFYMVCPKINKLFENKYYCDDGNCKKCKVCMKDMFTSEERSLQFINSWRETAHSVLKQCDYLIAPSDFTKKEILRTYSDLKINIVEHGIDVKPTMQKVLKSSKKFNIAFVGAIGYHKGSDILVDLSKKLYFTNIKLHLFGILDRPLNNNRHYIDHGRYNREELQELLSNNNIDLICLFSLCPETYSFTLSESLMSGIPALAFDIGAIAERIKKDNIGYVIPLTNDAKTIKKKIKEILKDKEQYDIILKNIQKYKINSIDNMSKKYDTVYKKHIIEHNKKIDFNYMKENIETVSPNYNPVVVSNYAWILDTLKWKIISKIKLPRFIKRILHRQ